MPAIPYPERIALAHRPTPLQRLPRLEVPGGPALWVKRDDLTGFGLSGNKVRKLEFTLAAALAAGADTVVTCGGLQSNHARSTALACAELGLGCELILRGEDTELAEGNLFIDQLCGARVHAVPATDYRQDFAGIRDRLLARLNGEGRRPWFIPTGASDGIGVWGYVQAAEELLADMQAAGFRADAMVHATGSGGTQAGLLAGLHLRGEPIPVWGVHVCDSRAWFEQKIQADLADWRQRYGMASVPAADSIRILEGYMAPGYGQASAEVLATIGHAARRHGLLLDPVYSGKAFHALLAECRPGGRFADLTHVVFIHTGGFFGSLASRAALLNGALLS